MRRRTLTRQYLTKPTAASRVTNGRAILSDCDGRSKLARRYRDICRAIMADQGGIDRLSETRQQLIRRFAMLSVQAEEMEARLVQGGTVDLAEQSLIASTLVRLATRIGIDRRAKNVTPTLREYLEAGAETAEAAE